MATVGFACIEKEWKNIRIIEYGTIETKSWIGLSDRLIQIANDLQEIIELYQPKICGIEKLFFFRNVTNGIEVAHARGVMLHTLASSGIPIIEFTPLQVKQWITGNWVAKKPQIQKTLQMLFRLGDIPKPDDAADALAIAYITALQIKT